MQTSAMSLFNQRVIEKLHADGLTIKDLADKIGMHRQALSKILNGHVDTTMGNAERIAEGLEVTLYELICPEEPTVKRRKAEPQAA
jgi:transcriptional regulator with XRE-family HTH domain